MLQNQYILPILFNIPQLLRDTAAASQTSSTFVAWSIMYGFKDGPESWVLDHLNQTITGCKHVQFYTYAYVYVCSKQFSTRN